ncbi:MAG: hypothetical protein A2X12_01915 [Bacteroidetes bacterium GWE2_29_8]|nr:MAG: hypothetical protein A2X12_01915 [Bacteroidetes bacterium GWE2_29_8]
MTKNKNFLETLDQNYFNLAESVFCPMFITDKQFIIYSNKSAQKNLNLNSINKLSEIFNEDSYKIVVDFFYSSKNEITLKLRFARKVKDKSFYYEDYVVKIFKLENDKHNFQFIVRDENYENIIIKEKEKSELAEKTLVILNDEILSKKNFESKLKNIIDEKDILLKEVHHRVKNNMQIISSMLSLKSRTINDLFIQKVIEESQDRIKTIALVHEILYQNNDYTKINFKEYILKLSTYLLRSFNDTSNKIKLNFDIDEINLSLDYAIPCGLIFNELFSNSIKYAFVNKKNCCIFVKLKLKKETVIFEIGDNGIGISQDFDMKEVKSFGLQLVNILVEQLKGQIMVNKNKKTNFLITFKI